jgi:RES domain-containing protein
MLYTSEHYSTAMLEKLAHGSGRLPPNQHFIEITLPNGVTYEMVSPAHLPGWDHIGGAASKAYGEASQQAKRSLLLFVAASPKAEGGEPQPAPIWCFSAC